MNETTNSNTLWHTGHSAIAWIEQRQPYQNQLFALNLRMCRCIRTRFLFVRLHVVVCQRTIVCKKNHTAHSVGNRDAQAQPIQSAKGKSSRTH